MKNTFILCVLCYSLFAKAQSSREVVNPNLWQDFTYDMGVVFGGVGHAYTRPLQ